MADHPPGDPDDDAPDPDGIPMTLLMVKGGYWVYEGTELIDDLLFGTGSAPFPVRCVHFQDQFEVIRLFGPDFVVTALWRVHPDVVERLRSENLLVEIHASDI